LSQSRIKQALEQLSAFSPKMVESATVNLSQSRIKQALEQLKRYC
jgi:hypothetical protein